MDFFSISSGGTGFFFYDLQCHRSQQRDGAIEKT